MQPPLHALANVNAMFLICRVNNEHQNTSVNMGQDSLFNISKQ